MNKKYFIKFKGASIAQYIIVICLIGLAIIPVYLMFGQVIAGSFNNFSTLLSGSSQNNQTNQNSQGNQSSNNSGKFNNLISQGTVKAGQLGGTPDVPVKECYANKCSIDFGTFVLNGITDNFDSFVETSGSSGGSTELANILLQIADQLDDPKTSTDEAKELRDLANLSHFVASVQAEGEKRAQNCISDANPGECYKNKSWEKVGISVPSNVSKLLPDFDKQRTFMDITFWTQPATARKEMVDNPSESYNSQKKQFPAFKMLELYDKIKQNASYSSNIKNITNALLQDINNRATLFTALTTQINSSGGSITSSMSIDDGKTVIKDDTLTPEQLSDVNSILHPKTSTNTDLDSLLMCVTGKNQDTGKNCYK